MCTILLYASGYQPEKNLAHYRTLQALPLVLGEKYNGDATYLDQCREKRNAAEYDYVNAATEEEAEELHQFAEDLRKEVLAWMTKNHPPLLPKKR